MMLNTISNSNVMGANKQLLKVSKFVVKVKKYIQTKLDLK